MFNRNLTVKNLRANTQTLVQAEKEFQISINTVNKNNNVTTERLLISSRVTARVGIATIKAQ